jgi:DNA-binding response OmpR family regulator
MTERIVLVEDDENFALILKYNLVAGGLGVSWISSAIEASEKLSRAPYPDLIILDWNLPRLSGIEILRRLRRYPATQYLPVFMLTCHVDRENREYANAVGATDFLAKTLPVETIVQRIRSFLLALPNVRPGPNLTNIA